MGPVLALAMILAITTDARAADGEIFTYGYPGCDYLAQSTLIELGPGEVFNFMLDLSACTPEHLGGVLYQGYKVSKNWSRPLALRDGVDLKMLDFNTGLELDYASLNGWETSGDQEMSYVELTGAGYMLFSAHNTNHRKAVRIRLVITSGILF